MKPNRDCPGILAVSLYAMIQRELCPHSCPYYCGYLYPSDPAITITADDREQLVDWCKLRLLPVLKRDSDICFKINERLVLLSEVLSQICSHRYTTEEIEDMEHTLLCGLSWRCYAPTAQQVGCAILSLILPHVDIPEVT